MPSKAADAPAIVVKKIANTEKIISELRSVNKLTRPSLKTSGCRPNFLSEESLVMAILSGRLPQCNGRLQFNDEQTYECDTPCLLTCSNAPLFPSPFCCAWQPVGWPRCACCKPRMRAAPKAIRSKN